MKKKTAIEKVASHPATAVVTNATAIGLPLLASVTPLVAALPLLVDALAAGRQTARIEEAQRELAEAVVKLQVDVATLTDDQFKLAGECAVAMLSTVHPAKLAYLRQAVLNSISNGIVADGDSDALGRLLRDISAEEIAFVARVFRFNSVSIDDEITQEARKDMLVVKINSRDDMLVGGLIRLGLLYTKSSSWDASMYEWSPLTAKLIALVRPKH